MSVDLVSMGEPMLEFNQQPAGADGRRLYLEGFGGDTSNAAIAAARQGAKAAYATAVGRDVAGDRFVELWQSEGVDVSAVKRSGPSAFASNSSRRPATDQCVCSDSVELFDAKRSEEHTSELQ